VTGDIVQFPPRRQLAREEAGPALERALAVPIPERAEKAQELYLDDPELLLALCKLLTAQWETSPAKVRQEAEFFYRFIASPKRAIGLFDERQYYLSELALIAGTTCRDLFDREAAHEWFERAEASCSRVVNAGERVARLAYQKLALATEERRFNRVLELAPLWMESFEEMELWEDALKCRFLEAAALREVGQMPRAVEVMREIYTEAEALGSLRLAAIAASNLAQFYRVLGDLKEALAYAQKSLPLLKQLDNRINHAKLRWCVGDILREQGKLGEAIDTYRAALKEADDVGMRGDVVAIHLVLADVLLAAGQDRQAEWEIRAALPIIDEEKMVPEGYAALSLLRQSLQSHRINGEALRSLHGFFRDSES